MTLCVVVGDAVTLYFVITALVLTIIIMILMMNMVILYILELHGIILKGIYDDE